MDRTGSDFDCGASALSSPCNSRQSEIRRPQIEGLVALRWTQPQSLQLHLASASPTCLVLIVHLDGSLLFFYRFNFFGAQWLFESLLSTWNRC